ACPIGCFVQDTGMATAVSHLVVKHTRPRLCKHPKTSSVTAQVRCVGCGDGMHPLFAETSHDAIGVLVKREGRRRADVPPKWRDGPLCNKCQAKWSAKITSGR